jgi:peptide deformylase
MAVRKILRIGDEALRRTARPVEVIDKRIHTLLDDMAQTMYAAEGAGLAAPQVGILRRVVVIDIGEGLIELINPQIISQEGEQVGVEGCLSIPGRRCTVKRPERVVVRALDRSAKPFELTAENYLAVAVCHELDHLDGVLYVDKMIEDVTDQFEADQHEGEED